MAHGKNREEVLELSKQKGRGIAIIGGGCFWCLEAVYQEMEGILHVESGYTGGSVKNPAYREVCSGRTGHAEVILLEFDPSVTSFAEILKVFWVIHDPTTLNRQGNDKGTQYRSAIFYLDEEQNLLAETSKLAAEETALWPDPIVTEISELDVYYPAEEHHQNYYRNNPREGYCAFVVKPKVDKFKSVFQEKLRKL